MDEMHMEMDDMDGMHQMDEYMDDMEGMQYGEEDSQGLVSNAFSSVEPTPLLPQFSNSSDLNFLLVSGAGRRVVEL